MQRGGSYRVCTDRAGGTFIARVSRHVGARARMHTWCEKRARRVIGPALASTSCRVTSARRLVLTCCLVNARFAVCLLSFALRLFSRYSNSLAVRRGISREPREKGIVEVLCDHIARNVVLIIVGRVIVKRWYLFI